MGVYDHPQFPFLKDEMRLIEQALREQKPILGVCLGSQLLAAALGAPVTKGKQKEIGWHPVTLSRESANDSLFSSVESPFMPLHWHGDVFDLPRDAVSLASSTLTRHQAFRYGPNAYGLLFHMEMTEPMIQEMVKTFKEELAQERLDGFEILAKTSQHLPLFQQIGQSLFRRWTDLIVRPNSP